MSYFDITQHFIYFKMNEILEVNGEFHLTASKFCLIYEKIIDAKKLYNHIHTKINKLNITICIAIKDNKTYTLINLEKQPNWRRRDKFLYEFSIPKIYTIKGSFASELTKYENIYPPIEDRPKKTCTKCDKIKEIFHFTFNKSDCKQCEHLSGETINHIKAIKDAKNIKDPMEYITALFGMTEKRYEERLLKLEKELELVRKKNDLYLSYIGNIYNISTGKIEVNKEAFKYKSGFSVICLGSAFALANMKNKDIVLEFVPPVEYKNLIDKKVIIYYNYSSNTDDVSKYLNDYYVVKNDVNTGFEELLTINVSKELGQQFMKVFEEFINDKSMETTFIRLKSLNEKLNSNHVKLCEVEMLPIIKYFMSKQINNI
jgi:hypothetical protein